MSITYHLDSPQDTPQTWWWLSHLNMTILELHFHLTSCGRWGQEYSLDMLTQITKLKHHITCSSKVAHSVPECGFEGRK